MKHKYFAPLLATTLISCAVGPDYEKPKMNVSQYWKHGAKTESADTSSLKITEPGDASQNAEATAVKDNWWENFNDTVLNDLVAKAVAGNKDVKIAQARVKEARANDIGAFGALLPKVDAEISDNKSNEKYPFFTKPINTFQTGFDASWELDIFGGNRRALEAAGAEVEASKADLNSTLVTLRAEVARNYFEVRNFQNQIRITKENISSQEESYKLTKSQFDAGTVSGLDVSQAEAVFLSTKSRLPSLQSSLEAAKNSLTLLLGEQPGELDSVLDTPAPIPTATKQFVVDAPATVIAQRPDIISAERNLAAATARQGVAIADFFPKISLSSFLGLQHTGFYPKTFHYWSLGAQAALPVLNYENVRAEVKAANAEQQQAESTYEKTVLAALSEIQTDLINYINEEEKLATLEKEVASNQQNVDLSKERYNKGIVAYTDVLIAQRDLYTAQIELATSQAAVNEDLIALNKALGR